MKKKLFMVWSLMLMAIGMMAVPAKRGVWTTITLADGTAVKVQLVGDEHLHYLADEAGNCYQEVNGTYVLRTNDEILKQPRARVVSKSVRSNARRLPGMRKVTMGQKTSYAGQKKGLVILAQYTDVKFKTGNDSAKYVNILNGENFTSTEGFKGSVSDYFRAQSGGIFELSFDVYGPVTLPNNQRYYGANDASGNDLRPEDMVVHAINILKDDIDFSQYDWDGDGEVDQVFVLYAGKGEADGGYSASNTVWPHMWALEEVNKDFTVNGIRINTYACSNEIDAYGSIEGIGCFCHEFSHCMGFPDMYDVSYGGWFGMGDFDLMCSGSYNGNSFIPAGYSGYEKMMCSWMEPIVLDKENVSVENLKPMSDGGQSYIIYNDGHPDEYYMLENRQLVGWDAALPGRGLMVTHIDFDADIWMDNTPNTRVTNSDVYYYGYSKVNDHQRITIFHADNTESSYSTQTDLYPYYNNDSLTNTSKPAATLYNANTDGKKFMNKAILGIKQKSDKTVSFRFRAADSQDEPDGPENPDKPNTPEDSDQSDSLFVVNGDYVKVTAADQIVVGRQFVIVNEEYKLAAGAYDSQKKLLTAVEVSLESLQDSIVSGESRVQVLRAADAEGLNVFTLGGSEGSYSLRMPDGTYLIASQAKALKSSQNESRIWKVITTDDGYSIAAVNTVIIGTIQFNYNNGNPRFLNYTSSQKPAILYVKAAAEQDEDPTAIMGVSTGNRPIDNRIFSIDGRFVGTDFNALRHGVYVVGGKKVVK